MDNVRECTIEIFEIAGRDYFLAKSILEESNLYFDFFEVERYFKARDRNTQLFIETALDHMNEGSLKKKELLKNSKASASMRSSSCIYLLLKYMETRITVEEFFFFQSTNSWPCISEMLEKAVDKIILKENDFDFLIKIYCESSKKLRNLAEKLLLRLPHSAIPFDYINNNKLNSSNLLGVICRRLILEHYSGLQSNDDLIMLFKKDYGSNRVSYINEFKKRIESGVVPKSFWEKLFSSCEYESQELALKFIPEYKHSERDKSEVYKFREKYNL